ncbi:GbsR/MarR family transcriptional regulator [Nocardiopsis aegyptia]|uniref:DNA-binding transcriptional regulator GbsR (MarR family) n=1 Tax=Nocardiopsis aegyptia TaxID=220378 RepID=A0A7Z0J7W0_9ACTN|nr:transcriptional regulator [Nocardiopsis aegyptia]NYJ32433.1 DNA-binding transcriptional regulator GbsR (MarR family) [Nocardiopsis aegyptia]
MAHEESEEERRAFAQELGRFFEDRGLPRMEGRVLGWLVVCVPDHQSAEQLTEALGASRGAISMAMRLLQRADAVERVTVPGSRRHYYRLRPGLWRQEIDRRVEEAATVRALTADGLRRLSGTSAASDGDLARLRDMHEMYAFLEGGYAHLRDTWRERESREHPGPASTNEGEQEWPRPGRRE